MTLFREKYVPLPVLLFLLVMLLAVGPEPLNAQGLGDCPYPPFSSTETGKPNILIILDHSGSMGYGAGSRWVTAKGVVKDIIDDFPNVRFGLMRLDGSTSAVRGADDNISIEDPYVRNGGKLLKPVGTPGTEINAYIDAWGDYSGRPQTWTVLAETLATAGQYFATVEVAGYHTGSDDALTLTDSNADFVDDGIQTDDIIFNTTDGSYGTITAVTATSITATLTGGIDNDWDAEDSYTTTKKAGKGPAGFGAYDKPYHPNDTYSKCYYRTGKLSAGSSGEDPYIDEDWDISSQPAGFQNHTAIRTYHADRYETDAELINIDLPVSATVYVAYQSGKTIPTWLQDYSDTGNTATVAASSTVTFKIYEKTFDAGIVTLGGNRNGSGNADYTYFAYVSLSGGINDCIASNSDDHGRYLDTTSPIENKCQQSFIILITDGLANYDNDWHIVTDVIGDYDNDNDSDDRKHTGDYDDKGRTTFLDDVAKYLYVNDMRSDIEGTQNLVTYVVGFYIDDSLLSSTAANGGGLYFTASSADALTTALSNAITDILDRISAGTSVSTITTSAASDDYIVRAKFLPLSWKGSLEAFTLPYTFGETPYWEGHYLLNDRVDLYGHADREIFTYLSSEFTKKRDFVFATGSPLVNALKSEWNESSDTEIEDLIEFIRGDDANDGGKYRDREGWILGDIIYSAPAIVGPPRSFFLENDYQTFKTNNLNRKTMVYVGANDGMLHAFDASDGSEDWAFIPEDIRPELINLTLDACHKYYVDLSARAYDVWDGTVWKTILLGGNRLGGEEYFALDITDPAEDAVSILWDQVLFTGRKSSTLPVVGKVMALEGTKNEVDKWVTVIASGYDEDAARTGRIAAVNFTDGAKETIWKEGNSTVNELATQTKTGANIYYTLTSPLGVDSDNDGYLDLIYAGDTEGSLWKFYYDYNDTIWKKVELFDTGGQAITARPTAVFDGEKNLRIYFGTGKYLIGSDKENSVRNAHYCIIDSKYQASKPDLDENHDHYTIAPASPLGPSDLADLTSIKSESDYNVLSQAEKDALDAKLTKGWYFLLDDPAGNPGERVLEEVTVVAGVVFFTSFTPDDDICGYGGTSRIYAVDYETGYIATAKGRTVLSADGGADVTERHKELGPGLASKVVYYRAFGTGVSSVMVQTSDTTLYVEEVTLEGKLWDISSWRTVE